MNSSGIFGTAAGADFLGSVDPPLGGKPARQPRPQPLHRHHFKEYTIKKAMYDLYTLRKPIDVNPYGTAAISPTNVRQVNVQPQDISDDGIRMIGERPACEHFDVRPIKSGNLEIPFEAKIMMKNMPRRVNTVGFMLKEETLLHAEPEDIQMLFDSWVMQMLVAKMDNDTISKKRRKCDRCRARDDMTLYNNHRESFTGHDWTDPECYAELYFHGRSPKSE